MSLSANYTIIDYISSGTGGKVFKAKSLITNEVVAIKSIELKYPKKDQYKRIYREICVLRHLDSKFCLTLLDLYGTNEDDNLTEIHLILPFIQFDLKTLIKNYNLLYMQIIQITYQLLMGLKYLKESGIIHRDLKPSNIGINENLDLQILDFGLARDKQDDLTEYVVTRWYRPLEIFCTSQYTMAVDMWSTGCIFAELFTCTVLFQGATPTDQSICILKIMGWPEDSMLEKMNNTDVILGLQLFRSYAAPTNQLESHIRKNIEEVLSRDNNEDNDLSNLVITLICQMLELDPDKRITPVTALESALFTKHKSFLESYVETGQAREFKCIDFQDNDTDEFWGEEIIKEIQDVNSLSE